MHIIKYKLKGCTVSGPDRDVTVQSGQSYELNCGEGLFSGFLKCQDGKFRDNKGNNITTNFCENRRSINSLLVKICKVLLLSFNFVNKSILIVVDKL